MAYDSRHAIPRPFQPPPPRTLVDCGVVDVVDQAVRSNLPARLQFIEALKPTRQTKIKQKPPSKNNAAMPSPGRSSPRPRVLSLIVVLLMSLTRRCGLIRPPGHQ
jgi:hypothetical protein